MNTETMYLIIIIGCLFMSAYFSASDTAFSVVNRLRLRAMKEAGNKRAENVLKLIENYDNLISSILVGNNIVNILSASLTTVLCIKWFGEASGPSISTAIMTVVVLIFGEITPKMLAKEYPESFTMFACPVLTLLVKVLTPFNYIFAQWKKFIHLFFKNKTDITTTERELLMFVEETANEGTITEGESDMIHNVIHFSDLRVIDILTPRLDIVAVDVKCPNDEIDFVFKQTGFSRLPIYDGSIDNIVGSILFKDFYEKVLYGDNDLKSIIKKPRVICQSICIKELMNDMRSDGNHIAIVVDEFGSTFGIVTLEDIIEELIGEIWDESDDVTPEVRKATDTAYEALGSASISKLSTELDVTLDGKGAVTVNGFLLNVLERIPCESEKVEYNGLMFTVISMNKNRVDRVLIERIDK